MLKNGGTALITVPGITMISMYDYSRWGHFWGVSAKCLRRVFGFVEDQNIQIRQYGNAKVASGFLYGLAVEDMDSKTLEYVDERYPIVVSCVLTKK